MIIDDQTPPESHRILAAADYIPEGSIVSLPDKLIYLKLTKPVEIGSTKVFGNVVRGDDVEPIAWLYSELRR